MTRRTFRCTIDSMEAIDSGRIATFVGEFEGVADYTVVALLPDADETVNPDYHPGSTQKTKSQGHSRRRPVHPLFGVTLKASTR